ncbi:myelin-oligodendrocyte glycoprotein-like [Symphorus nematophorus]
MFHSPLFRLLWILASHWSPEVWASDEAQLRVTGAQQPIRAAPGDDVILPCHVEPWCNVERMPVEWSKPDLKPDPADMLSGLEYVHLYRGGRTDTDTQLQSYVGRTDLCRDGLRRGDVSLKIKNVTAEDGGRYRCCIPKLNGKVKDSFVELIVDPNYVKTSTMETPLHHSSVQPQDPKPVAKGEGDQSRRDPMARVAIFFAVLMLMLILILVLIPRKQNVSQREENEYSQLVLVAVN